MVVLLADRELTAEVRAHPWVRDAHGLPVPTDADATTVHGPYPGAASENANMSWTLRIDARCWPLRAGDKISDDQGNVWVLAGDPKLHQVPGVPDVDYIDAAATLDPPRVP